VVIVVVDVIILSLIASILMCVSNYFPNLLMIFIVQCALTVV